MSGTGKCCYSRRGNFPPGGCVKFLFVSLWHNHLKRNLLLGDKFDYLFTIPALMDLSYHLGTYRPTSSWPTTRGIRLSPSTLPSSCTTPHPSTSSARITSSSHRARGTVIIGQMGWQKCHIVAIVSVAPDPDTSLISNLISNLMSGNDLISCSKPDIRLKSGFLDILLT